MKKGFLSILLVTLVWHLLQLFGIIDAYFFPPPLLVLKNIAALATQEDILFHLMKSSERLVLASFIAIPLALVMAMAVTHVKILDNLFNPLIAFTFPLPKVAIYPLLLLITGIGDASKVFLIALGMFYLVFINVRVGLKRLMTGQAFMVQRIYRLKKFPYIYDFLLKGCQLEILTGLKLAFNYGLTLVVVGEITTSNNGIGYYIWRAWDQFKIINVYSGVYLLSFLGFLLYYFFDFFIEKSKEKFN